MQDDNRKTKIEIKCILGTCTKKAIKAFVLIDGIHLCLCGDCFSKILRQQSDRIKNKLCAHEWHGDQNTMKNFCIHCEIQQPELENGAWILSGKTD